MCVNPVTVAYFVIKCCSALANTGTFCDTLYIPQPLKQGSGIGVAREALYQIGVLQVFPSANGAAIHVLHLAFPGNVLPDHSVFVPLQ